MYVLVRKDLPNAYQAVMSGHLLAQHMLDFPGKYQNGTLVYINVDNELEVDRWIKKLGIRGFDISTFREPDIGNQLVGIACFTNSNIFDKLKMCNY
jgi:hypothetical protein